MTQLANFAAAFAVAMSAPLTEFYMLLAFLATFGLRIVLER